MYVYVIVVC